jgi:hypothetical protein
MKTLQHILLIILLTVLFAGCEKILDVEPTQSLSADEAIQNRNDVLRALTGCYDGLQQAGLYSLDIIVIPDLAADNLDHTGTRQEYGQIDNNAILAENFLIESVWNDSYDILNRVNSLLVKLPEVADLNEEDRNAISGQLLFIRALIHFKLVIMFGPVPVKTLPTTGVDASLDVARDPVEAVYEQIIADLEDARAKAGTQENVLASSSAASALLARVYLYTEQWTKAVDLATEVIDSEEFEIDPDYNNLFSGASSKEIIFQVEFNSQDRNSLAYYFYPTSQQGRNEFSPSQSMLDAYEDEDTIRQNASIADEGYAYKYRDITNGSDNVTILRLAEMYLIRAEARAQLNGDLQGIKEDINVLRSRAGLAGTQAGSYGELKNAIEQERRVEFAFEGHRWFDLVRTGRALEVLDPVNSTDQLLFPIPLSEITSNTNPGMYQNPGY